MKTSYAPQKIGFYTVGFLLILLIKFPANAQYCESALGGISCGSSLYEQIINVSITGTTLNHTDTICHSVAGSNLAIFPASGSATAVLTRGNQYVLKVTTSFPSISSVWIDYNQNGLFAASSLEWKRITTVSTLNVADSVVLDIPWGALGGQTRMRIRTREDSFQNDSSSACAPFGSGEAEDYTIIIDIGTNVSKNITANDISVVPNPASNQLTISFSNRSNEISTVLLMNAMGQTVYMDKLNSQDDKYSKTIDLTAYPRGIYSVQLLTKNGIAYKKIVVE